MKYLKKIIDSNAFLGQCLKSSKMDKEVFISELGQCREDERCAQTQMISTIAAAGTILSVIFGISNIVNLGHPGNMIQLESSFLFLLFSLSVLVYCVSFGYITSLGITAVLRFHYIRYLEDKINDEESDTILWMSFSAPITTKNILHIKNKYTFFNYLCYSIATLCAIIFCIVMVLFQYNEVLNSLRENPDSSLLTITNLIFMIASTFIIFSNFIFFYSSFKAKDMFKFSKKRAFQDLELRQKDIIKKSKFKFNSFLYFFYPKLKDVQKSILILIGYYIGNYLKYGELIINKTEVLNSLFVWFVFDFLLYQGRYILNDLRGIKNDKDEDKTDRFAGLSGNFVSLFRIAILTFFGRYILAFILICFSGNMKISLLMCTFILIVLTFSYEYAKSNEKKVMVFFLVCVGYPLRFLIGIWSVYPKLFSISFKLCVFIILLLISLAFYGEFSAIIPWTHEVIILKNKNKSVSKKHYQFLYSQVIDRSKQNSNNEYNALPLHLPGRMNDLWNFSFIGSIFILSIEIILFTNNISVYFLQFVLIGLLIWLIYHFDLTNSKKYFYSITLILFYLLYLFCKYKLINIDNENFMIVIDIIQLLYVITYFFLRFFYDPDFNFIKFLANIYETIKKYTIIYLKLVIKILIGKEANDLYEIARRENSLDKNNR